ncbi:putative motility protein [Psychromonas sp. MME2]|uniref:putative motility protein n=1 Tax=unclassified Psychromonas TaxID=2614957 RepID=UPI00339C1C6B
MDMAVVGSVLTEQNRINTLEKVNINLLKTTNNQAEQQAAQLIDSIAPVKPEGSKGHHIDVSV